MCITMLLVYFAFKLKGRNYREAVKFPITNSMPLNTLVHNIASEEESGKGLLCLFVILTFFNKQGLVCA